MEVIGGPDQADPGEVAPFHVGDARLYAGWTPFEEAFEVRFVRFEPGARSRPHHSSSGRILHVVSGEAVVADPLERVVVGRGDTVVVPPGEWHWHGGLPHVGALLLVISRPSDLSWNVPLLDWAVGYDAR